MSDTDSVPLRLVLLWARTYTRGLPVEARERRLLELESDMWEQLHDRDDPGSARAVLGRSLRGIPADVRWRYRTLLDQRGARQRSQHLNTSIRSNWWVILTAVLGSALVVGALSVAMVGSGSDMPALMVAGGVLGAVAGGLVLGGLVKRRDDLHAGSRLIFAGCVMSLVGMYIAFGAIVLITGFWTGNLQLSERPDEPQMRPVAQHQIDMTARWYVWLVAAAVLFAIGWLPLIFDDPEGFTFGGWLVWILSWTAAMVTAGVGVILSGLRLLVRHRTRLA